MPGAMNPSDASTLWTGETRFKLKNAWRNESKRCFNTADLEAHEEAYLQESGGPQNLSERYMSAADRLAFREAKSKELASFFANKVWFIDRFRDPYALAGKLNTTAPTLTRLSRNMVMAVGTMLNMSPFTADITTAFLQGKPYRPEAERVIWIKLPKDGEAILELEPGHGTLMRLVNQAHVRIV
eukprot:s738_g13.t1